jgi:iron complex outermembrane receptor protein
MLSNTLTQKNPFSRKFVSRIPQVVFFLILIGTRFSTAQNVNALLVGKVTDEHGLPLSNVSIMFKDSDLGTITNEKGNYVIKLPAGNYLLIAKLLGYKSKEQQVRLLGGKTTTCSFFLEEDVNVMKEVSVSGVKAKSATATRTLTQIQDVPQAISVVGQKTIKQQAAFDLTTIVRNISGLNFTGNYAGAGSAQFFNARGFDLNSDGETYQNFRWNGVMIWNWGNNYSDNIEQVEFLKGPTSILYGDVSPGGILNFVTKKPLAEFSANVNFKAGSWGLVRPAVDITGPITSDRKLRYRLNTSFEKSNSFRDYVSSERYFVAPAVTWDITPKISLNVEAVLKKSESVDDAGLVSPDGTTSGLKSLNPSLYLGEPSRQFLYNDQNYFATLTYELSKTWRLKAVGFYNNALNRPYGMWFDQPDESGDFVRREYGFYRKARNGTASADLGGTFYTGLVKHNVLIGAEYQSSRYRYTNIGALSVFDSNNIYSPVYGQTPNVEPAEGPYQPYASVISRKGIYVQDQLMFFKEKLHVLLGFRQGNTRQGIQYNQNELAGTDFEGSSDNIVSKWVFTPRIGLVYKLKPWYSLYGSYANGYEINSPDLFAKNYKDFQTPPATTSSQVEFGSKANLLNNKLGVTLSVYEINKHNPYGYVYLNPENPNYDEYNIYYEGQHQSRGIELEADGRVFSTLSVAAGATYTKTKVIADPGYPAGNLLPNAPKFTANGWLNYEPTGRLNGLTLGTGLFYKGKFFSTIANDPNLQIPASYTCDVAVGYTYKQIGVQLNVMNVTNQVSYLNPWVFNLFDVRPLRQFILSLNYRIGRR